MPVNFEIDHARKLVLSTASGTLKNDDIRAHMDNLARDPGFDPSYVHLLDLRAVVSEVTGAGLRALQGREPWTHENRRAFVCDSDLAFGMSRMAERLFGEEVSEIRVFREMFEALAWLRIDGYDRDSE